MHFARRDKHARVKRTAKPRVTVRAWQPCLHVRGTMRHAIAAMKLRAVSRGRDSLTPV
jgi:hypothetical protein